MTKLLLREEIVPAKRRAMTPARKRRIHKAREGKCCDCGTPDLPVTGPGVIYHHWPPLGLLEKDLDERVYLRCLRCDQRGTPQDISDVARAKRRKAKNEGTHVRRGPKIRSPGFDKTRTRKMNGKVVRRG